MSDLLADTLDHFDQAKHHLEDALAFFRKAGYRLEMAWACCDYADTFLQRDNPGDPAKVTFLLDESRAIITELCMEPLMGQMLSRRNVLKA